MKHTHTRRRNCHKTLQRMQSPRPTFSNTNGPWRQTQPRTHWQERSGSTRRQEGKSAGAPTPVGLTGAWRCSLSLSSGVFPFHQGKAQVGCRCRAGEKQGGSPKQTVSAAVRTIASNPSWGLRAASSSSSRPALRAFGGGSAPPRGRYRESSASRGRPNGQRNLKPQQRGRVDGKQSLLHFKGRQTRWEGRLLSRAHSQLSISGREFLQGEGASYVQKQPSQRTVILKLVISRLTSVILTVLSAVNL